METRVDVAVTRARASRVPVGLLAVKRKAGRLRVVVIRHFVEDKKLSLRTEVDGVSDSREFQIAFGPNRDRSRIEPVALFRDRVDDVGDQTHRSLVSERVDP